ncbi:MAG: hypothetical protein VYC34_04950 [Planctomycetota bacterium]|nr:hypothetical protein [Planctomycetota bacterium]
MRRTLGVFALLAAVGLTGCASSRSANEQSVLPVNATCPIGGHEVAADSPTVTYEGKTIAFCCDGCKDDWDGSDAARRREIYLEALVLKRPD